MHCNKFLICGAMVVLSGFQLQLASAGEAGSFEYWSQLGFTAPIVEQWEFEGEGEMKLTDDARSSTTENVNLAFVYGGLADWVDLGVAFKREFEKDGQGQWQAENRPQLNVTFKATTERLAISNRSRMEYRDLHGEPDYWRYRNLTTIKLPVLQADWALRPYVAMEPFFSIDAGGFKKNRTYVGIASQLHERISAKLFYLWATRKSGGQWDDFHILGTNLMFHFR